MAFWRSGMRCQLHRLVYKASGGPLCSQAASRVSTWSPLGIAFNSRPEKKLNFSLDRKNVGLFEIPELRDHTGFYLLQQGAEIETEDLVAEATDPDRTRKMVQVFDQLSDCLCRVADMADFIRVAHPDNKYSQAAEDACVNISGLVEKLNTNVDIHKALQTVIEQGDVVETSHMDKRVAELFMFDFEQSGIHLPEDKRAKFVELNEDIMKLGTFFMQGSQKPTIIKKSLLPEHLHYIFGLDGDDVTISGLYSDHHSELVREAAYRIYLYSDPHQHQLLDSLLSARDELAKLVGFPSYAHRALRGTMGDSPEQVMDFLKHLAEEVRPRAEKDFEVIQGMKASMTGDDKCDIKPWDTSYFSGIARHERWKVNNMELAPYLSLGSCMEGVSLLTEKLFGVKLQYEQPKYGELWSYDVHKIAVVDEKEGVLGHIYCDFFERPGKPHTDCHFTIRGGRVLDDGSYQNPIVVLMLNLPPPRGHIPSLLTPGMMENLFHELGHAMHSMLGRTTYQHVTGTRCPTDFAEVPSILMEYFASDPRVISSFARHWQTGECLPENQIKKLCSAKQMFGASEMQLQVFYSILDQNYHSIRPLDGNTTEILETTQNKYYSIPYETGTAWQLRFGHYVGYGAKYYSYLMSRAVATRIWHKFFKDEPFNRSAGESYRSKMLVHGGGKPPSELVKDMLEEEPTTEALVESLMIDLDSSV